MRVTEAEVREAYKRAPENLRVYVASDELFDTFHEIRKAHNLHLDQAGDLELALHSVVLGFRQFNELPVMMREILVGIKQEEQDAILKDFNDKVFVPLRDLTRKRAQEAAERMVPPQTPIRKTEVTLGSKELLTPPPAAQPTTPQQSVIAQKLAGPAQPTPQPSSTSTSVPAPTSAPTQSTPRYHGTDPYREPV